MSPFNMHVQLIEGGHYKVTKTTLFSIGRKIFTGNWIFNL